MSSRRHRTTYLPPVNKLPVELLSYVFGLSTHGNGTSPDAPFHPDSITTPLAIAGVSRHWRAVAHSTSTLWTSICITVQDLHTDAVGCAAGALDINHVARCLALSQNAPLSVFIDARDRDWDFSEAEIPSEFDEYNPYTHPFTTAHMSAALALLLPHARRWRTLDILTDTWAPMYVALRQLSLTISTDGAPALEALTLMRCNDFVSFSPAFQPAALKQPVPLNFGLAFAGAQPRCPLPRLRSLTLRGVHVHWASLPYFLPPGGLRALELSYHSPEVCPTPTEFHAILRACPALARLTLNGSGPSTPADPDMRPLPAPLPHLRKLTLGYRTPRDGCAALAAITAPNLHTLALEDAAHPADPAPADAGPLLAVLAGAYAPVPFPRLADVRLTRVRARAAHLAAVLAAAPHLARLELAGMAPRSAAALLPARCPKLRALCVRGAGAGEGAFLAGLPRARAEAGARGLCAVDVYEGGGCGAADADAELRLWGGDCGAVVRVFRVAGECGDIMGEAGDTKFDVPFAGVRC